MDAALLIQRGIYVSPVRRWGADLDLSESSILGLTFFGMISSWWLMGKRDEDLTSKSLWFARRKELLRSLPKEQMAAASLKYWVLPASELVEYPRLGFGMNDSGVVATKACVVLRFVKTWINYKLILIII